MPSPGQVVQVVCDYYGVTAEDVKTIRAVRGPKITPGSRRDRLADPPPASKMQRWKHDMAREMIVLLCVRYGHSLRFISWYVGRNAGMVGRIALKAKMLCDPVHCVEAGGYAGSAETRVKAFDELKALCDATVKTIE
jgi:hypothetical protein